MTPAPGEAGKMPFWHGDRAGRPLEFGRRIGALVRELREMPRGVAMAKLVAEHDLEAGGGGEFAAVSGGPGDCNDGGAR